MTIKCYNLKTFKWKQFESSQSSLCQKCVGSSFQFCTLLVFTKPHVSDHTKVLVTISNHCMHSIRKKVHETWKTLVTRALGTCNNPQRAKGCSHGLCCTALSEHDQYGFLKCFFQRQLWPWVVTVKIKVKSLAKLGGDYLFWLST